MCARFIESLGNTAEGIHDSVWATSRIATAAIPSGREATAEPTGALVVDLPSYERKCFWCHGAM